MVHELTLREIANADVPQTETSLTCTYNRKSVSDTHTHTHTWKHCTMPMVILVVAVGCSTLLNAGFVQTKLARRNAVRFLINWALLY